MNTSYILEGSLRRSGDRVRINASLVQTTTGHSIWGERFDRKLQDMFDLQDEIARSIASALRISISAQEEEAIAKKPTENTVAYDCYLRARSFTRRVNYLDLEYSLEMLERAISLQPDFALAHASIARVCSLIYYWYGEDPSWIEKARSRLIRH